MTRDELELELREVPDAAVARAALYPRAAGNNFGPESRRSASEIARDLLEVLCMLNLS